MNTKKPITEDMLLTWLIHWRDVIEKELPGAFESNPWLQHLGELEPSVLLVMATLLDEFVNTEEFKQRLVVKNMDEPQLSGHVLTLSPVFWEAAGHLGAFVGRVNNLMWASVFILERPESADFKEMYETFYILTGSHDGAKYFKDLLWTMDRLLPFDGTVRVTSLPDRMP